MRRAVVIVNPLSGRGRHEPEIRAHAALASDLLRRYDFDATIRPTTAAGDAHAFAQDGADAGVDLVIAWGGDGTINEVASALVHRNIPLAIVPAGSGNGLASDLRLPFNPLAALTVAATGRDWTIDAGRIHESLFFNIAGVGIDAVIAARFAERGLRQRGPLAYLQIGVAELVRRQPQRFEVCIDDDRTEYHAILVAMANGRQYGNRVLIAPGARLDDGLLEVVIVEHLSVFAIARRLPSLFLGTLKNGAGVTMRAAREIVVSADAPIPYHVDGEPRVGPSALVVQTVDRALLVRVPR